MFGKSPLPLAVSLAAGLLAAEAFANPVDDITNGEAWRAKVSGGPTVNMTLNPDGTGRVRVGPIGRKVAWQQQGEALCIAGLPNSDGPKCFEVSDAQGGYQMRDSEGGMIDLTRR